MACIYFYTLIVIGIPVFGYALYKMILAELMSRKLERWKNIPKDEIILHAYPRGRTLPNPSPYPLKLETYLRLADLKYTLDPKDSFGPKGKTPWISLNGKHMGDTDLIINYLNKKFDKNLNLKTDETILANARIIRVMLEEFFMWAVGLERLVYGDVSSKMKKVVGDKFSKILLYILRYVLKNRAYNQGIGRHTQEEVREMMSKNLISISLALGSKMYFGGDEMCEEDCGIFGVLAQTLWGAPDSPYEKLMENECKNLKEYCLRVKDKVYPDWDQLITH